MNQTVIYEITAVVRAELVEEYEKFMREQHIPDLLATGYFQKADFTRSGTNRYRIRYESINQKTLDEYLNNQAETFRADFLVHFPTGIKLSREVWEVCKFFNNDN
jgi:hypothetical protein